ncbi:phosphotransferase [Enterococcus sp. LJL98]
MNIYDYDTLKQLSKEKYTSQRVISEKTGYSLGKVNEAVHHLLGKGFVDKDIQLTERGKQEINKNKPQNAIILAAGFGMRMVPINAEIPKGLLEVHGEILIERLIRQLNEAGIQDITIVVGFLKEKYEYLIDQFNVKLVYNGEYAVKNNLHSLCLVSETLGNTYILPSDIWLEENPFSITECYSWYLVTEVIDEESTVRVNRQRELMMVKVEQGGNAMIGVSYLTKEITEELKETLLLLSQDEKYDNVFWEEALFTRERKTPVYGKVYLSDKVMEIDTYEQLRELDSHSIHLNTEIIHLISEALQVLPEEVMNIEVMKKGMTNRSFKFSVKDASYIMRIPGEGTDQLIDRSQEYDVYQQLKDYKISDDVIYMSPKNGYKITRYIENSVVCDSQNPKDVKESMKKIREFHERKLTVDHSFDLFGKIDFYESLWEGKPSIFKDYLETKNKIIELQTIIDQIPKDWVLTHVDAVPENILFTEEEIRMIDWEYAGMQDPHLDIAMFAIYSLYEKEQVDALIDSYFIEGCSEEIRMKIYCYIAISGLLWSNWCEYKHFLGVEFGEYSLRQYRYAKEYYKIVQKMEVVKEYI